MKSTLYGVIKVDPKQLLEDGIRRELVRLITLTLHHGLAFNPKSRTSELTAKLNQLKKTMTGLRTSFQYIQDYVNIAGLKIWQEELSRIFNFYVEQEANVFLKQKVEPAMSVYQRKSIPIPMLYSTPESGSPAGGLTFMGRLAHELVSLTSPKTTIFVPVRQTWYDSKTQGTKFKSCHFLKYE